MQRKFGVIKLIFISLINGIGLIIFFPSKIVAFRKSKKQVEYKKILIFELWGIGDLIIMSSVIRHFKKRYPTTEISLLSKSIARDVFKNSDLFDEIIEIDFPWTRFKGKYRFWTWDWKDLSTIIMKTRGKKFDLSIDARGDLRNNLLSFLIGAKKRIGYDWSGGGYFLTDVVKCNYTSLHRADAWANLLTYIGVKDTDTRPVIVVNKEEGVWADEFLKKKGIDTQKPIIGIHPGARIKTRCWPLERFSKVANYLKQTNSQVIVFIDPDGYGEDIILPEGCLKVRVNLREFTALVKELDFLVCNDGGAMHIATAVCTPVVAVFGPTDPARFGPYGGGNIVVLKENVPCRPCFDYCRYKEPYCLTDITAEQVIKQVDSITNKARKVKGGSVGAEVI
jgi:heptosyltransferase I